MSEISEEKWKKAINHAKEIKFMGQSIGPAGIFYVMSCNELIERYENGERTEDLYKSMIDLH